MLKKTMKAISLIIAAVLLCTSFAGCGQNAPGTKDSAAAGQNSPGGTQVYPLKGEVTLKYWMELHSNVAAVVKNFGETEYAKELQKRTGVKIEYLHPAAGQAKEAFSVMVASGDLPDIIEYTWLKYPGGPNSAIKNKVILNLNDTYQKYAPNLTKFLKENPEIDKMTKTDEGNYYAFPFLRPDESLLVTFGPTVRKDWLDDLGLGIPETLDDWYTMLKAFKEKKNATAPLTAVVKKDDDRNVNFTEMIKLFSGATESYQDYYIDNGTIHYGPMEPNRKAFFEVMAKWYKEGLIDKNFVSTDNKAQDANMTSGKSGATLGSGGSGLGKWMAAMKDKDPKYNLVAVPFPTSKKGTPAKFGVRSLEYPGTGCAAITTKCKNVEAAARLLDYSYSQEGHMLVNFGMEGTSYKMEGDYPKYTDLIMKNPNKLPITSAMSLYLRGHTNGPFMQDKRYLEQYYSLPQQKEAATVWAKTDQKKYRLLPITPTEAESKEFAKIMGDVNTYVDEMTLKFIMGTESIESFDKYVSEIKKLNIDKAIAIYQAALDRYKKRK